MRRYKELLLTPLLAVLISCSGGDSSNDDNVRLGGEDSLHPGLESLLDKGIEDDPAALSLQDAEAIKQTPRRLEELNRADGAQSRLDDASLLSQFDMYPNHGISSRVLGVSLLMGRDVCLRRCLESTRCGAVTHINTVDACYYHGPTQSIDKLAPTTLGTNDGVSEIDTYVITSRNQVYEEAMNFKWTFFVNDSGTAASPRMKLLFTDGSASTWKDLGPMKGSEREDSSFEGSFSTPAKDIEGFIMSTTSSDGIRFTFMNNAVCLGGDCSLEGIDPYFVWIIEDYFTLDTDCDSNVADGCAAKVAFYPNTEAQVNAPDIFADPPLFTRDDLKRTAAAFIW